MSNKLMIYSTHMIIINNYPRRTPLLNHEMYLYPKVPWTIYIPPAKSRISPILLRLNTNLSHVTVIYNEKSCLVTKNNLF